MIDPLVDLFAVPILVEWLDTRSDFGWVDTGSVQHKAATVQQLGFLLWEDDDVVTVMDSYCTDHTGTEYGNVTTIPRGCIVRIREMGLSTGT